MELSFIKKAENNLVDICNNKIIMLRLIARPQMQLTITILYTKTSTYLVFKNFPLKGYTPYLDRPKTERPATANAFTNYIK